MKFLGKCKKAVLVLMAAVMMSSGMSVPAMAHGHGSGHHSGHHTNSVCADGTGSHHTSACTVKKISKKKGVYCAYHCKTHKKKSSCKKYCEKHHVTHKSGKRHRCA